MSDRPILGIDWCDLAIYGAYALGGQVRPFRMAMGASSASAMFEPNASVGGLGVSFPSPLRMVGRQVPLRMDGQPDGVVTVEKVIVKLFSETFRMMEQAVGARPGLAAMAVPGVTTERRRAALIAAIQEAGCTDVRLVDACTAASAALRSGADESKTLLIYRVGYAETEIALVRVAKGRVAVVATEATEELTGELLNALMIRQAVRAMQERQIFLGLKQYSSAQWLELQLGVSLARRNLRRTKTTAMKLAPNLTGLRSPLQLRFAQSGLATHAASLVEETADELHAVLDRAGVEIGDVDAVYLLGEDATGRPVSDVIASSLGVMPHTLTPEICAVGAAIVAAEERGEVLTREKMGQMDLGPVAKNSDALVSVEAEATFVVVDPDGPSPAEEPATAVPDEAPTSSRDAPVPAGLEGVRALVARGDLERAVKLLDQFDREIDALRKEIASASTPGAMALIEHARRMIESEQFLQAVRTSHAAYEQAPSDPEVFLAMMDIHCDAGLGLSRPEQYRDAITQIRCAMRHDPINRRIPVTLAKRHLMHARDMCAKHNVDAALTALEEALRFDPKNAEALALKTELTREEPA